jgi:hypothetical protein
VPSPLLMAPEELRSLAARAITALYDEQALNPFGDSEEYARGSRRVRVAIEALRFCASAAAALRDVGLLPLLVQAIQILEHYNDDDEGAIYSAMRGIEELLRQGGELSPQVRALARHERPFIRMQLAWGLRPRAAPELSLLKELASDPVAEVREAARSSLGAQQETGWWQGKFSRDPLLALSPEEQERLGPVFEELSPLLDNRRLSAEQAARLTALAEQLPDEALLDLARTLLADYELARFGGFLPLGGLALRRGGAGALLYRLLARWSSHSRGYSAGETAAEMLRELPVEVRLDACRELLALIAAAEPAARAAYKGPNPYRGAATVVAKAWPAEADPSPVLEAILALPEAPGEVDASGSTLCDLFRRKDLDTAPLLERFLSAHLSGCKGPWSRVAGAVREVLERASPERLRPAAGRALESGDDSLVAWGLLGLLGRLHDPDRDPAPTLLLQGFFEDPRYRRLIYEHSYDGLGQRALPFTRAELRRGSLGFLEAAQTMLAIDRVYGGLVDTIGDEEDEGAYQRKLQAELDAFLGPGERRGPPTEEEWRRYRAARDAHAFPASEELKGWSKALQIFPVGEWSPEDRAFLQRAIGRYREDAPDIDIWLAHALSTRPLPEYLPVLDELLAGDRDGSSDTFKRSRKRARKKLGLTAPPAPPVGAQDSWMDEEEEDDDL